MKTIIAIAACAVLGACTQQPQMYEWGGYQQSLIKHYKNPSEKEEFATAMRTAVDKAEGAGKVPPGLYAEYGYALLEAGDDAQALLYLQKEADMWPEAQPFLSALIGRINDINGAPTQAPATAEPVM